MRPLRQLATLVVLGVLAACGGNPPPAPAPHPSASVPARGAPPAVGEALLLPVAGVHPFQLRDSYDAPRSGGRTHKAIDIPAPHGTPVLAAADGRILRLHVGNVGGNAIYHLDADGRTRYYYAHLNRYADGLAEGQQLYRGQVIGYVGDTGNAGAGNYHLHFSIAILDDPRRWWEGVNLNPYQLLGGR
ncbi:MAG: peptidoglycan DD-metalloendopeptidase family protein [Gemmatimonadota bacterium]|nr:peptidoglycan DD-metalloendopeptidase family protein [Gemmatimonadota bacterium]